ncbi:ATP-binding protein [Streptosporangium sp. NBC_01810]|uniref:ATP-binding protein n=1 Tax=Streptosporangium sp. NBC_01810 TaxID=2975951 RepID=UPI002DD9AA05|nr:ATP-binding protein [Streptosporangium sp. NBC_01810]
MRSPHLGRIPGWSAPLGHTPVISQRFAATPDQVRPARVFVAELLGDDHPLRDDAILLTSELATNAVEYSSGPVDRPREFVVTVAFISHGILITVQDSGTSEIPCTRKPGLDATGGRGLMLVNDLATRWGFHRDSSGTLIWFELEQNSPSGRCHSRPGPENGRG